MDVEPYRGGAVEDPTVEPAPISESLTHREWDDLVDVVVERIEQRVIDELERRGRRFIPDVF